MNPLIIILLAFGALLLLLVLFGLIARKTFSVEEHISISKPKDEVFAYVNQLKNQDQWSKWQMMDPNMKKEYKGTDGTVGFVSGWDSEDKNVGKGEQEITAIKEGERIDYELRFIKPFESTSSAYMITESLTDNTTKVKWGFETNANFPMNLFLILMGMEKSLSKDFNIGLNNLKSLLEMQD
jgi:hypothetical protein